MWSDFKNKTKGVNFRKAALPVTLAVNYLTSIFDRF